MDVHKKKSCKEVETELWCNGKSNGAHETLECIAHHVFNHWCEKVVTRMDVCLTSDYFKERGRTPSGQKVLVEHIFI